MKFIGLGNLAIPNNKDKFEADFFKTYLFSIKDIFFSKVFNNTLYLSTSSYDDSKHCYSLALYQLNFESLSTLKKSNLKLLINTSPCLKSHRTNQFAGASQGGRIAEDDIGNLYISTGDFYFDGVNEEAVTLQKEADYGKVIKIDMANSSRKIVAKGLRNPQGLIFLNGRLYETEHGPQGGDELNVIPTNRETDFGWPVATYGVDYGKSTWPLDPKNENHLKNNYQVPMHFWIPSIGVSNLAAIPQNSKFLSWRNDLLVTSLKDMAIYRMKLKENSVIGIERIPVGFRIRDIIVYNDIIYLLEDGSPSNIWTLSLEFPSGNLPPTNQ